MRAIVVSVVTVVITVTAWLPAQELTLPRKELDDAIKAARDAKIQELTAEQKTVQKAIAAGGKGYGDNRREAIINARKKLAEVDAFLASAKAASGPPELNIEKLAVGQIGKLYRSQRNVDRVSLPSGTGGASTFSTVSYDKIPVSAVVVQLIGADGVIVECGDKLLWLRMASAGIATGQKLPLDKPLKVAGTKPYFSAGGQQTIFELVFFGP